MLKPREIYKCTHGNGGLIWSPLALTSVRESESERGSQTAHKKILLN